MYRRLKIYPLLAVMVLLFSCSSSGETVSPSGNDGPKSNREVETETMFMKLRDFIRFEEIIPPMALNQEQKDGIILVLREWKDFLDSGKQADEDLYLGQIASLLTEGQNAYEPVPDEKDQSGPMGKSGPPSGGSGGPGGGQGGGPQSGEPGGESKETSSLTDQLDMMIRLLSGEEAGDRREGGPPPPQSED